MQYTAPVLKLSAAIIIAGMVAAGSVHAQPGSVPAEASLLSPVRIAPMENGPLLVTDYNARSVCAVNRQNLKVLRCFPVEGKPTAVAWAKGSVYVGNETSGTVEVYNPSGKWRFDLEGGKGSVRLPNDIAVDERNGRIFVVDGHERNIKVFGLNGSRLFTITGPPAGAGALANPTGIAYDALRNEVLVSDYGNPAARYPARIHVFDNGGNYVTGFSGRTGGFSRPQGIAVEGDRLYITDGMLGSVLVLERTTGAKIKALGTFGSGPGQLMLPLDVAVDPAAGDVFVTNNRNGRVERFREGGQRP